MVFIEKEESDERKFDGAHFSTFGNIITATVSVNDLKRLVIYVWTASKSKQ